MLGYIPSPSTNGISVGPLRLHMYGFLIVAGVFAAVWLSDRRWRARGGEAGTFSAIALWGVPGGLIGARIYHVATDYELYTHHPLDAFKIWQGGLGIWGGIAGGVLAAWIYVRRNSMDFPAILDTVAPALPLAQAIGRWGNYFNQELFGRPTSLPWGLRIDAVNRPLAYAHSATFQPTFLYESLWDLAVVVLVLWAEKHVRLRKGYLFGVYVALYTFGRFFTEYLRIDFAHKILGLRINDWTSVIIFVVATTLVLRKGLIRDGEEREPARVPVAAGQSGGIPVVGGDTLDEDDLGIGPARETEVVAAIPVAQPPPTPAQPSPVEDPMPAAVEPPPVEEPVPAAVEPQPVEEPVPAAAEPQPVAEPLPTAAAEPQPVAEPVPTAAEPQPAAAAEPAGAPPSPTPAMPTPPEADQEQAPG